MATKITIYHNPRCMKSRETLELIEKKGIKPLIVEYLQDIPSQKELIELILKLGIKAEDLVRKKEKLYLDKYAGKKFTEKQWIKILTENPILIERPIVVNGKKAAIGRPPKNVLKVL
jgi:arsenate reductase